MRILAGLFATLLLLLSLTALAVDSDANQPEFWGEDCHKIDESGGLSWTADADYRLVVLKAGQTNYEFYDVEAGDVLEVPQEISHFILCDGSTPSTTTTTLSSTTIPSTTTTIPTTTTTTDDTTTTSSETTTTSTERPTTTTPTTTTPNETTTSSVATTSTTDQKTTTTVKETTTTTALGSTLTLPTTTTSVTIPKELPRTGIGTENWVALALLLFLSGWVLVHSTRSRR